MKYMNFFAKVAMTLLLAVFTTTMVWAQQVVTLSASNTYTANNGDILTGSTSGKVTIPRNVSITLRDVTITGGISCHGTATITLEGTNIVTGNTIQAGIRVGGSGTTLTIRGDGSLTATGGTYSAGIGLNWDPQDPSTGGNIVIEGGNITANGGDMAAGIGTCMMDKENLTKRYLLGAITIKGGTVTATGGESAAGIGTGSISSDVDYEIGAVTIYNTITKVDASSISEAITYMYEETDVTANAADYFNIVEDGNRRIIESKFPHIYLAGSNSYTVQNNSTLTGSTSGTVTIADGASITLRDVTITGGIVCEGTADITLEGTNSVTGADYKAGIQVGGTGTTLTIRGDGSLTATGKYQSAGIGLSRSGSGDTTGGDIVIEGGNITAKGGWMAAGIGTGTLYSSNANGGKPVSYSLGAITIKGGTVTATGDKSAGIGTGYVNDGATYEIGAVTIYTTINKVDASGISETVTYMHGETDVTANATIYFSIEEDENRCIIESQMQHVFLVNLDGNESYTVQDRSILTGSTSGRVTIADGASIMLRDATITGGIVCEGTATITLAGENSVMTAASIKMAGIQVGPEGTTLTICGDGSLKAKGGWGSAGIGLSKYSGDVTGGDIVIEGGSITATGGLLDPRVSDQYIFASGIGLGMIDPNTDRRITVKLGDITIKGGKVTAIGSWYASGIGNGYVNASGTIQVGKVTVYDDAIMVDATSISQSVTYMHGDTDVTSNASDYFTITRNANRYLIMPKGIAEEPVTIADGTPFTQARDYSVPSATYTKTLDSDRKGRYQAWMVPFDYTITDTDLQHFNFYKIHMIANSPSPSVEASDEMWVFLTMLDAGDVLQGNMPYVYKPLQAVTDYEFTTTPATVKGRNTGMIMKTETSEDVYSFYATYENTIATPDDPFYYVNIDGGISFGDAVTVGPYRWIIRKESKFGNTPSYVHEMHFWEGEEDATGINLNVNLNLNDDAWYDMSGRKVANGQKPTAKGLYLYKGRKEAVR